MLDTLPITAIDLRDEVKKCFADGWRFATMTAVDTGEAGFDILYHFDKDLVLKHYRLSVAKDVVVPSISPIYFAALLVENEIEDQFGIKFADLVLDFGGSLYLEEEVRAMPFCKVSVAQKQS
ncbi:MAG: NADH-quinone oxidoreductase subunit C [Desulfovibrionaceae bacterium]